MSFDSILSFIAALFACTLGIVVFLRDRGSLIHRAFGLGMVLLALESFLIGLISQTTFPEEVIRWQHIQMIIAALLPGVWLLFSMTYGRVDYGPFVRKYRAVLIGAFVVPLIFPVLLWRFFLSGEPVPDVSSDWLIPIGWSGYAYYLCSLIIVVLILMNLERTLRTSVGHMRWQIKYMILGLGCLFGVRIYLGSQTVLFRHFNSSLMVINSAGLILGCSLILPSIFRHRLLGANFYLSGSFLYNSMIVLVAGIYFLAVGILAKVLSLFKEGESLYLNAFIIFIGLAGASIILLSDRLRQKMRYFVVYHLRRPKFDYREEWAEFGRTTACITKIEDLCSSVVKRVSKTLETLSVTIWLLDEKEEKLVLGGSTVFTKAEAENLRFTSKTCKELIFFLRAHQMPVDLMAVTKQIDGNPVQFDSQDLTEAKVRYCIPLVVNETFLGILTLEERVAWVSLSMEDADLLKIIADHTAGSLLNLKLSQRIQQYRAMEAYQTMSTFMVHDLKNLASTLSLTMQNLPIHFENPEFRNDALQVIQQSMTRINKMCGRLSLLSQKIELKPVESDLNEILNSVLSCLDGSQKGNVIRDLQPLPRISLDSEQIQKVITNLILNANEASPDGAEILISTRQSNGWVTLSVKDNGCGMTKEFVEQSLFTPFKTTKKNGMGIGLFHSRMIVEAHKGRMEVESEVGRGTTFRVLLPVAGK